MPQANDEARTAASSSPPKSWLYFLMGGSTLACVGLLAAILWLQFLQNRPVDLRGHATYFAEIIERTLQEHHLTESDIHRSEPELRRDDKTMWFFYRFEVSVPVSFNADGLKDLVSLSLAEKSVNIAELPQEGSVRKLSMVYSGHEFAQVSFMPAAKALSGQLNMRAACYRLARNIEESLNDLGIPREAITRTPAEDLEDAQMLWALTQLTVQLPEGMTGEKLKSAIDARLTNPDVQTRLGPQPDTTPNPGRILQALLKDKLCVELHALFFKPPEAAATEDNTQPIPPAPPETPPAPEPEEPKANASLPNLEELPLDSVDHEAAENGTPAKPVTSSQRPRIAIILDDGGYGKPDTDPVMALDTGLTLSILPNTPYATALAELALKKGFEILLHMPMETHRKKESKAFPGEITVSMTADEVKTAVREALKQVPECVGVNNHTGGLYTQNAEALKPFLEVLLENQLFFVDSRTVADSKGLETARALGLRAAARNVFLDNDKSQTKIRKQLKELIKKAKDKGQAIGIGHFRANTLAVLAEELPKLKDQGIDLVHVSELVQ